MTQLESIENFIKNFEKWRRSVPNLTQKEIAEELGVTRSHLNKVLNHKTLPSIQLIEMMENFKYKYK